jgi:hypothetical protein
MFGIPGAKMKITNIDTLIEEFRNGRDIWSRTAIELAVREIERQRKYITKLEKQIPDLNLQLAQVNLRITELKQERRWIPVRDYPSQVGWYRVITNNGTEQIREYVREPDRDIHYWDVKDGEWIMMYTNPPLPQPPQEETK